MKKKKSEIGTVEGLRETAHTLEQEIFALRNELARSRKLERPHLLREKKRERARVLMRIAQKEREVASGTN
ncbi:MAG: 50S ribosomal protein L29 [Verrucomicrobiota bacterium]|nr:50S ribosomal protein L29 [Verrucomicrobiota bacterium]